MKLVIFRKKDTNEITGYQELNNTITQENVDAYNSDSYPNKAEIVDLKEDSVAYYFYKLKAIERKGYYEDLRDIESTLRFIESNIDDRLSKIEHLCMEEEEK